MALSRRTGQRFQGSIWPGFVDAMTGLLLVLMFVLTIFMMVQFVLRETITGQESELDTLSADVRALASALGLEKSRSEQLETQLGALSSTLDTTQTALEEARSGLSQLQAERDAQDQELSAAQARITDFETQVAGLLAQRADAQVAIGALEAAQADLLSQREALNLALAHTRTEVDAQLEAARLAAAQREELEAMIADLQVEGQDQAARIGSLEADLSQEETAKLAQAAAAERLREQLQSADTELTAMTLALEDQRRQAEETLTLLAAAEAAQARLDEALGVSEAARADAEAAAQRQLSEAEERRALLALANRELAEEEAASAEAQRQTALLNQQVAALRAQLGGLQSLLDEARRKDEAAQIQLQSLGSELNVALARVAAEERRRRTLEEAENTRLEAEAARLAAEAQDLERYRSEFFGRLRDVLGGQDGVRIVGDRFVFSSEVLFSPGSAVLSSEGQGEIAKVVEILSGVTGAIPKGIDWVIQVDGHTDNLPLSGFGAFSDNWELSQGRALSVVRFMSDRLGVPPDRLSANGFGEYQPVNSADTAEARAQNRRIELKFTEK